MTPTDSEKRNERGGYAQTEISRVKNLKSLICLLVFHSAGICGSALKVQCPQESAEPVSACKSGSKLLHSKE
jgi:hypothetical protein